MEQNPNHLLLNDIVDRISVGVFVVNKNNEILLWNGYMENYSQKLSADVVGKNIFEEFPDLPENWLKQKIHNVFVIKNFSFTSWEHRPYLFKFLHNRPITGGIDYMRQNCTFLPMKGESDEIESVCITLFDVTDTSIYENMLKNAVRSLAEASNRDALTDIYNRRYLESSMSKEFSRIKRYGGTLSFIIIDLDHFKLINDTHGHLAGDEILKVTAKRIAKSLRTADTLSRYGGEEFAVMLPETPIEGAGILAQRICDSLSESPIEYSDISITVTASLGIAEFNSDMNNHEEMISRADEMLYRSKDNGRNQVTIYYPDKESSESTNSETNDEESQQTSIEETTNAEAEIHAEATELETAMEIAENAEPEIKEEDQASTSEAEEITEVTNENAPETNAEEVVSEVEPETIEEITEPEVVTEPANESEPEPEVERGDIVPINQAAPDENPEKSPKTPGEEENEVTETEKNDDKTIYVTIGNKSA